MTYQDLTLHQRIGLKGFIMTMKSLEPYKAIALLFNIYEAVNMFLDETYQPKI